MDTEAIVTIVGLIITAIIAPIVVPLVLSHLRKNGVDVSVEQETFVTKTIDDGTRFAESLARNTSMTSSQKCAAAVAYAKEILDKYPRIPTPTEAELRKRVEARLAVAIPGHAGTATAAIAPVPAQDTDTTEEITR